MQDVLNFIDGRQVPAASGEWLDDVDPATGAIHARVASSDARDVDRAVAAALRAFPAWSATPAVERSKVMRRLARLIERDLEKLARAESIDSGKPLSAARTVDIPRAMQNFDFFADAATQFSYKAHFFFFLMIRHPPSYTQLQTLFPYTTLLRSRARPGEARPCRIDR